MKFINGFFRFFFFVFLFCCVTVFTMIYTLGKNVSANYKINVIDNFSIKSFVPVTCVCQGEDKNAFYNKKTGDVFTVDLKMFGVIPFSTTTVEVVDETHVAVLGQPFGMKIYTDGVLVIELSDVETENGIQNPAAKSGIKIGDYIKTVDGIEITCNEDLSELVTGSDGEQMNFQIVRNGKIKNIKLTPKKDKSTGNYRAGIWVRDSSAGIGTLTFYSPYNDVVCGLGHGISDSDTKEIIEIDSGELVGASISEVKAGKSGDPGELIGRFTLDKIADIISNNNCGVYGKIITDLSIGNLTEVALKQEVKDGKAQIITTINGKTPTTYSCKISQIDYSNTKENQSFIITITDNELISKTGGIVQGMSGSPIIQNGKLIGAVTHVLVDDPTTGYGIFAENMLNKSLSVNETASLKNVS